MMQAKPDGNKLRTGPLLLILCWQICVTHDLWNMKHAVLCQVLPAQSCVTASAEISNVHGK